MIRLTKKEVQCLKQLEEAVESHSTPQWGNVYLDNARGEFTPHQFAALLASLAKKGLYRSYNDDAFGQVSVN